MKVKSQEFSELDISGLETCFTTGLSEYWPHHSRLLQSFNIETLLLFKKNISFLKIYIVVLSVSCLTHSSAMIFF